MARLLEGKPIADRVRAELKSRLAAAGKKVTLASIQVGSDHGSEVYVRSQKKNAGFLGIEYQMHALAAHTGQDQLAAFIQSLNADPGVNGIILQLPLPPHIDYKTVSGCIAPDKDVEGMNPVNLGRLLFGRATAVPCTAASVMELLAATGIDLEGKEVVIVGHSAIVGKPLSLLLLEKLATVTVCHIGTSKSGKLEDHIRRAEVLIVAVGHAGLVKGEWVREDAVVIDVGINRADGRIVGDVEFSTAQERASWITPVPGGVGPLTVTMLMRNLVEMSLQQ